MNMNNCDECGQKQPLCGFCGRCEECHARQCDWFVPDEEDE